MKQYELRWATMPEPIGRRPVLLITRTPAYHRREGFRRASVANLDNIHVVAGHRVGELIGTLADTRHREVKRALGYSLDWAELKIL